jgi:Arc/MetJ-type ribon-helix-helix transcriptional regulator
MPATYTTRRSVAMTPQLRARLQQLLAKQGKDVTEANLIRQAIHEFLDRQEDITGSRAHFRKTFQERIDTLETALSFRLDILLALVAHWLAVLLPVFTELPITAEELIQAAIVTAAHDLKDRLDPACVPSFMTDGLWAYFYALTAHFGRWFRPKRARTDHWAVDEEFRHGQLVKRKERRTLKYAIHRMAWGKRSELFDVLEANGFRRVIQTAFVERLNLTFRRCIAALARQTWSLVSEQPLLYHAEWFRLYYHLARPHAALREPVPGLTGKYRDRTPAMALGITDRVLTVGDILRTPLIPTAA